jgi:hypothetical protein
MASRAASSYLPLAVHLPALPLSKTPAHARSSPLFRLALSAVVCGVLYYRFVERYGHARFVEFSPLEYVLGVIVIASVWTDRPYMWPLLVVLMVVQHVYFGGITHFPQLLLSGRSSLELCWSQGSYDADVATFTLTLGNEERMQKIEAEMAFAGIENKFVQGSKALPQEFAHTHMGHALSFRAFLQQVYGNGNTTWVALFEDDAALHWNFKHQIECVLGSKADVVWLDTRSHINYSMFGYTGCCMAGMLMRRSALPRIIASLGPDSAYHMAFHKAHPEFLYSPDPLVSHICSDGRLECLVRPLVSESGFKTQNPPPAEGSPAP